MIRVVQGRDSGAVLEIKRRLAEKHARLEDAFIQVTMMRGPPSDSGVSILYYLCASNHSFTPAATGCQLLETQAGLSKVQLMTHANFMHGQVSPDLYKCQNQVACWLWIVPAIA